MISDKDTIRQDRSALVVALEQAGAKFKGNACTCPFHDDHRPSGGVFERDGIWRYKCQACGTGGDVFDIRAKIEGTTPAHELSEARGTKGLPSQVHVKAGRTQKSVEAFANLDAVRHYLQFKVGRIVDEHCYTNENGDTVQMVFRCDQEGQKTYRPINLTDKGYCLGAAPAPRPLYNLPKLIGAETVICVEGEKCCDVLSKYGFVSTTSAAGAKSAKYSDWTPLAGKRVVLWPDNDAEGRRYMADVEQILQGLQPLPIISSLDPCSLDLAEMEDVADFVKQLKILSKTDAEITTALDGVLKKVRLRNIAATVQARLADIANGRYSSISWPWDSLDRLTHALKPGTVTLIPGSPGASKSFMTLQAFVYWHEQGLRVSIYELEEDRTYHLMRVLAQKAENANLTDDSWVKENFVLAASLCVEHSDFLNSFGRILHTSSDKQPTLCQLAGWIEDRARAGSRIIGIDPVTMAARTAQPWEDDKRFLERVKRIATEFGCSVVLVTHPIKAINYPDMSQIAGSTAYSRFAQTIFWLESHPNKESKVKTDFGRTEMTYNRTLHIIKANNGRGMGLKLAFEFDSDSLTLRELGLIMKNQKGRDE